MFPTGSILWLSTERAGLRLVDATLSETFHHVENLLYAENLRTSAMVKNSTTGLTLTSEAGVMDLNT